MVKNMKVKTENKNTSSKMHKIEFACMWIGIFALVLSISMLIAMGINGTLSNFDFIKPVGLAITIVIGVLGGIGLIGITAWLVLFIKRKKSNTKAKSNNRVASLNRVNSKVQPIVNRPTPMNVVNRPNPSMMSRPVNTLQRPNTATRVMSQQSAVRNVVGTRPPYSTSRPMPQVRPGMTTVRPGMSNINRPTANSVSSRPSVGPIQRTIGNNNTQRVVR